MKPLYKKILLFGLIGGVNTAIDFAIFNALIYFLGLGYAWYYPLFKGLSFTIACVNSYLMNAHFTFSQEKKSVNSFSQFFVVTSVGMAINILIATLLFNFIKDFDLHLLIKVNLPVVIATFVSMVWNFVIYNYVIFSTKNKNIPTEAR